VVPTLLLACLSIGQQLPGPDRLTNSIDSARLVALPGKSRALRAHAQDQGRVADSFPLPYITLTFVPSPQQRAALSKLLAKQQKPSSPYYHKWLTPEEYADRFGISPRDMQRVQQWLESQGFSVIQTARGRDWVAFSGTARQVTSTFHTEIHRYTRNGEVHFANATEPSVPTDLRELIAGYRGLDDFAPRSLPVGNLRVHSLNSQAVAKANDTVVTTNPDDGTTTISHFLAPDDVATIYNLSPLYKAGTDGTGQRLVVVGQSEASLADIQEFRQTFQLPANDPDLVLVPGSENPGHTSEEFQGDMDLEWAGAVARNAKITYVYAAPSSGGAFAAAQYAIDNNLAPVISMSYGSCEFSLAGTPISSFETELMKANAQGITILASTGTSGPAACDANDLFPTTQAMLGLAVNYPASSPEVTAVGGTQFKEGTGNYWSFEEGPNSGSVLSYIPEVVWNDTPTTGNLSASGGGMSGCITASGDTCTGGFTKPSWQDIFGVPPDGVRDVPDLAFASAQSHDGYIVCTAGACSHGGSPIRNAVQGVTAATPVLAGIITLLNQHVVDAGIQPKPGLGNINPALYQLVQAGYPSVFHDITAGSNVVPCLEATQNCETVTPTTPNPLPYGYAGANGYDLATGLGSLDASNFATAWGWVAGGNQRASITRLTVTIPPNSVPAQQIVPGTMLDFNAIITAVGANVASGTVTLFSAGTQLGSGPLVGGVADIFISPPLGGYSITAVYSGDANYDGSTSEPVSLFVGDFTVTVPSPDFTLQSGDVAYIPVTVTPAFSNYSPTLSLQCFGAPTEATCTFKPPSVQPAGGPITAMMVVKTTSATAKAGPYGKRGRVLVGLAGPVFFGMALLWVPTRSRVRSFKALAILVLGTALALGWIACATTNRLPDPGSQPAGPIPLNITATTGGSNPIFHSVTIMMNLQ